MDIVGQRLGRFSVLSNLGQGSMASVYKARDEDSGQEIALKLLPGQITRYPDRLRRFKREYQVLSELDHPNIIRIYEFAEADGFHFYTMQYLEYPTLAKIIQEQSGANGGFVPFPRAVAITAGLVRGLSYIHEKNVVHRDVKPANCYVPESDQTVLADFGLVKATEMTAITMGPSFIGTPQYASPEQIMVDQGVDGRSDLYQAGLVLYEMVTGRLPFSDDLESILSEKCLQDSVSPPTTHNSAIPESLEAVILKATSREAGARYGSGAEMLAALEGLSL